MPLDHEKLKSLRNAAGLTQQQAAEACEMGGRQAWNDYESGRKPSPNLSTLEKFADLFKVDVCDLLVRPAKGKRLK